MKKLICLVLAAIMICALVGCNSVSQSDIDELTQRITQLEDKNKELEDELRDQKLKYEDKLTQQESKFEDKLNEQKSEYEDKLNEQKSEYEDRLNEQDKKIEDMQKDLDYLEQKTNGITGTFYSLKEAYDNGWLTREDIMHIAYFRSGSVGEYDEDYNVKKVDFKPTMEKPVLSERLEADIKESYYKLHKDEFDSKGYDKAEALQKLKIQYLGQYKDSHVVVICPGDGHRDMVRNVFLAGIAWWWSTPHGEEVFRFN